MATLRWWACRAEPTGRSGFVEVTLPHGGSDSGVELVLRDGTRVRLEREFDDETLRRVIAAVERD